MKVTYTWLKDFVDIALSPAELADRLTMAGLEVESAEKKGDDTVYTIEVTSNRPDWLSVAGIAREVSAITGVPMKKRASAAVKAGKEKVRVEIENTQDCSLYTARILRGVSVKQSPEWMRRRLELVGVRPVNNVVDITNYVLFELGEPLHAFDLDKLNGNAGACPCITIRRSRAGEKIVAIDGKEYSLDPGVLVIADAKHPVAIAGVMGGKETEVSESTRNVLLEAAVFDPVLVRRGRQKLTLASEASYRFERGIDPLSALEASSRAAGLLRELCGATVEGEEISGSAKEKPHSVSIDQETVSRLLGVDISAAAIKKILSTLGFAVKAGKKHFTVTVPSFRRDVKAPVDLVEEIARIYGYDNIPSILPPVLPGQAQEKSLVPLIKEICISQGLDEVLTYSLMDRRYAAGFYHGSALVEVSNPLSAEQEVLRPVLMPGLCRAVAYNLNQRQPSVALFEVTRTYTKPDREQGVLGIALSGSFSRWLGPQTGNVQYDAGFLGLKGILTLLFSRLGIDCDTCRYEYRDAFTVAVLTGDTQAGTLKRLTAKELDLFDIKGKDVFLAEISLDTLVPMADTRKIFKPYPRFPSISRDITLELDAGVPVEKVLAAIRAGGRGLLKEAAFRDYYDKNMPRGVKRITVTCVYSAADRTLTEAEIAPVHAAIIETLKKEFSAQIR